MASKSLLRQFSKQALLGSLTFAAGWWLKPDRISPIPSGSLATGEMTRSASKKPEKIGTGTATAVEYQAYEVKRKYLPADGREPSTLLDRMKLTFADQRPSMQAMNFARYVSEMDASEAPAVLALLEEMQASGERYTHEQMRAFYTRWGDVDPEAVLGRIKTDRLEGINRMNHSVLEIMQGWASKDMPGALAHLNEETDPKLRSELLRGLVITFAGHDLAAATKWASEQDPADAADAGDSIGWTAACSYGLETGNAWYRDLPNDGPGGIKEHAWSGMIKTAQKRGGEALMNLIQNSSDLPWCKPDQICGAVLAAHEKGTSAALNYAASLPLGALDKAGDGLDILFSKETSTEVNQWLEKNPSSPAHGVVAARLATRLHTLEQEQ